MTNTDFIEVTAYVPANRPGRPSLHDFTEGPKVKIHPSFEKFLLENDSLILFGRKSWKGYPFLAKVKDPCGGPPIPVQPLHEAIANFYADVGLTRRRKISEDVHHANEDKLDVRASNLRYASRSIHSKHHASKRQKFRRRKKTHHWRKERSSLPTTLAIEEYLAAKKKEDANARAANLKQCGREEVLSKFNHCRSDERYLRLQAYRAFEEKLAALLPGLQRMMNTTALGITPPHAPNPRWKEKATVNAGVARSEPRKNCTTAEAAFVYLFAYRRGDRQLMARDLGVDRTFVDNMFEKPSIDVAVDLWLHRRELPTACGRTGRAFGPRSKECSSHSPASSQGTCH